MRDDPAASTRPPQPEPDAPANASRTNDPVRRAARRIRSVDAAGTEASDDTIDTDGKGLEAARDSSPWQDNVIFSNATAANHLPESDPDLAGVDSRPGHGGLLIATTPGHAVTYQGTVTVTTRTGTRTALRFTIGDAAAQLQPGKPVR
ncbi:DUF3005 domain-containing protein [Ralstonia solanacearum]|uniref:DUF3005 domain-containing protein n=1 Tax=Ralstonia solanacearum (strain Po82) TaxID=1031711 RepID=F6G8D3_RALS8|nr:DUF3005 domain-containing protein [Ralstonia solanacearum]AEG70963.1 conserved hypothetical protein [Ralstonia solanacearum Po82]AMP72191.1 hypothetical protein UW163_22445 [Ralstonia solanacearum]AMP77163.1 hypothetical protein RALBFv3_21295 [Ralstonia solanacearum]AYB62424.1 DUF3005 domain-containing protein [Ralstonia solanacearum]EUJ13084.1 hypothetical protein RSP673_17695 [Ralstonia solanacearum P673]